MGKDGPGRDEPEAHHHSQLQLLRDPVGELGLLDVGGGLQPEDIGITISGGAYPTVAGQPEAWKESVGFAGTFSPTRLTAFLVVSL